MEEVRKHNTIDDGWIVFDGKVYDITNFVKNHPGWIFGGQTSTALAIKRVLGSDCTKEVREIHPKHATAQLELYRIGSLQMPLPSTSRIPQIRADVDHIAKTKTEEQETLIVVEIHAHSQGTLLDRGTCSFRLDPSQTQVGKLRRLIRIVLCARGYLGPTLADPVKINDRVKLICSNSDSNAGIVIMSDDYRTLLSYGIDNASGSIPGKDRASAHFLCDDDVLSVHELMSLGRL